MTANLFKPHRPPLNVEIKSQLQIGNGNNSKQNADASNAYNTVGRTPQGIAKEMRAKMEGSGTNSMTLNIGRTSHYQMPSLTPQQQVYSIGAHSLSP